ncbi:MMPL family transporter [Paenibacillus eucommiae]|uniref:RND superfamily putative drug exporter n=1 Tax=Paenibacillus eucommiae TaxID=1355755 RepID=A0ABS4J9G7_9BACL|nr:MMPL family transporter [Paenibacillus eucommiae]MBP1995896.1 RND superfamily putative drug exporter [Paenibacillus eucommiae]
MKETSKRGRFWSLGRSMYRYRKLVVILWVLAFIGFALLAQKTPGMLKDNGFTPKGSDSEKGLALLQQELDLPAALLNLVYVGQGMDLTVDSSKQAIMDSLSELKQLPYVQSLVFSDTPRNEGFNHVQTVIVGLNLETDVTLEKFPEIKKTVKQPNGMDVYVSGGPAILYDMQQASKSDIVKAEVIGLPIALIVLLIVFGTLVGAFLPMVVGLMSVTTTLGITYLIAQQVSLSNFLPNMVTMLGLAVGIDYALFLVSRFREELRKQPSVEAAVAMTCQTAGKSIFFSGAAVLIGLLGMFFVELNFFRSLGLGGIIVVTMSVLVANTLLLSLLGMLGEKINSLHVIPKSLRNQGPSRFWELIAYGVMKRPLLLVIVVGCGLLYMMSPLTGMKLGVPNAEVLPPSYESRYGSDLMKEVYDPKELNPVQIRIHAEQEVWEEETIRQVRKYAELVAAADGVEEVRSYVGALGALTDSQMAAALQQSSAREQLENLKLAKSNTAILIVVPGQDPDNAETDELVRSLRKLDSGGLDVLVTGGPAYRLDIIDRIQDRIPEVLAFVIGITYLILLFAFRSVLIPLKAVLMNVLSLGASMGIVVLIFQHGFLADVLQITSTGYVSATLPIIIFCVVFGISMDYEVFLISRIAEEHELTGDNERSTAEGLKKTGSLITSAAFILIVVVGSFIFTDIEIMKALGLGLGLAVLIDATIIRVMLVPALMKLLGEANWWAPKWLRGDSSKSSSEG